jgi:uncharacterized linocin/CFP29 family protein
MDLLRRHLAPIPTEAWEHIDETARRVVRTHITARRFVDVSGPHGPKQAAVGTGRLDVGQPLDGVEFGVHRVLPLVEVRARFTLDLWELDNAPRGARDPELGPLIEAARRAALFEDRAVLHGFEPGRIRGLLQEAEVPAEELSLEADPFLDAVSRAVLDLHRRGVKGPYALVVGASPFRFLATCQAGYPLLRQVERLTEGPVLQSDLLDAGLLVSTRGGDAEITLGVDLAVGYEHHTTREVHLFITESFTFQVLDRTALVPFRLRGEPRGR